MSELSFKIVGEQPIHCEGCEQRITNALKRLEGVREVRADHRTQEVRVAVDPARLDAERVRAKLGQIGFEAEPQEA